MFRFIENLQLKNPRKKQIGKRHLQPKGFTLVELLVVIAIIAVLASLISVAVVNAINAAHRGVISQEIMKMDAALKVYKNTYGSYPPSTNAAGELRTHLNRVFIHGGSDITPANVPNLMSQAEILVFCLSGYSTDKSKPITGVQRKPKLYDFDESRLVYYPNPGTNPTPLILNSTNTAAYFPVYRPAYPVNGGAPYVYFCTSRYVVTTGASEFYQAPAPTAYQYGIARPYAVDNSGAGSYPVVANKDSFQIICGGLDGHVGGTATSPYETVFGTANQNYDTTNNLYPIYTTSGVLKYAKLSGVTGTPPKITYYYDSENEPDNLSNCWQGQLGDNKP